MSQRPEVNDRLQFGIGFLLFVTAGFGLSCFLLRSITTMAESVAFRLLLGGYVLVMSCYVLIRVPLLIGKHRRRRARVLQERRRLAEAVRAGLARNDEPPAT